MKKSLKSLSLLSQQCLTYLVHLTWMVCKMGCKWLDNSCFVGCYWQDSLEKSLKSLSLLSQQCLTYLVHLTRMICKMGSKWLDNSCFVGCYWQDSLETAHSNLEQSSSNLVVWFSETKLDDFCYKCFQTIVFIFIVISTTFRLICPPPFFRCLLSEFLRQSLMIFIINVFGLLSLSLLLFPQRFGWYVLRPSSGVCQTRESTRNFELRLLLNPRGVACSDSVSHNWVQVLSIPVLLLVCSLDWTCNLQMCPAGHIA